MKIRLNILRHGTTQFNLIWKDFKEKYKIDSKEEHFCNIIKYLPQEELIDCSITEEAKVDILKNKIIEIENINKTKVIIVSPLLRVLESARLYFDTEKNDKLLKIVHPSLRATLLSMYDIPINCRQKFEKFEEFDFSLMKDDFEKYGFEWFLYDFGNNYKKDLCLNYLKEKNLECDIEKAKALVLLMRELCPVNIEDPIDVCHRIFYFKKWLRKFIKEGNYADGEITLISHEIIFIYLVATLFKSNCYPIKYDALENIINSKFLYYDFEL